VRVEALRFAAVGVVNTLVGLAAIYACLAWLGLGDAAANFFGYCIGCLHFAIEEASAHHCCVLSWSR
jgi:putative flippase GtrA